MNTKTYKEEREERTEIQKTADVGDYLREVDTMLQYCSGEFIML